MTSIPAGLLEARNGVLMVVLSCMLLGDLAYLFAEWREIGWWQLYRYRKAAIAQGVFLFGMLVQTAAIWAVRHLEHTGHPVPWSEPVITWALGGGGLLSVIGGLCWLRVTLPTKLPHWLWVAVGLAAFAFGIGMALR